MRLHRIAFLLSACAAVSSGCNPFNALTPFPFPSLIQSQRVLGATGQRILLSRVTRSACSTSQFFGPPLPSQCGQLNPSEPDVVELFSVNPSTLVMTSLNVSASADDQFASDGERIAWVSVAGDTAHVFDTRTSTSSDYEVGDSSMETYLGAVGDRFLALVAVTGGSENQLRVISLEDGDRAATIDISTLGNVAATSGNLVAYLATSFSGVSNAVDIHLLNMVNDDDVLVAAGVPFSDRVRLFIVGGVLTWSEYNTDGTVFKIRVYDPAAGTPQNVFIRDNGSRGPQRATELKDVSLTGMLISQRTDTSSGQRFELLSLDGIASMLYAYPAGDLRRVDYSSRDLEFVGTRVIWADPYSGQYVLHNPATGTNEQFDPYSR